MKSALIEAALRRESVMLAAERIGVSPQAIVLGAFEVIRDLSDPPHAS